MSAKRYKPEQVVNILRQIEECQWEDHAASLPGCSDHGADVLSLEEGVRRVEGGPGEAAEGTREGELSAQTGRARHLSGVRARLVAGACNVPNALTLPFRLELLHVAA